MDNSSIRPQSTEGGERVPLYRVEYSNAIDMWLDKFERTKGPLTIMKTDEFREKSINQIASAIRSQVIEMACQHVVIDNLQFLVNQTTMNDDHSSSQDRFHLQRNGQHIRPSFRTTCLAPVHREPSGFVDVAEVLHHLLQLLSALTSAKLD
ncbi:unnamed protein product [Haemonchus placei]|uniref:Uncharacterized protein n=1 Tax=Haemonchus placei TaxID=6290 RepID=A0A0N4WT31_HAEPC|nr:unnamed protein product [Haemonchus placei]